MRLLEVQFREYVPDPTQTRKTVTTKAVTASEAVQLRTCNNGVEIVCEDRTVFVPDSNVLWALKDTSLDKLTALSEAGYKELELAPKKKRGRPPKNPKNSR